jgi:hypothetical protein
LPCNFVFSVFGDAGEVRDFSGNLVYADVVLVDLDFGVVELIAELRDCSACDITFDSE